ncbi:RHS repeat domain-containing protein [Nonomuraea helvata]|uniref:RHS repeat domain-containing protein n=3 Tax=Nonomuraea helvata TaxID=37484 RepID=A0ABV5RV25_9ACTN
MAGEKLASVDPTGARNEATYDDLGRQITTTQIERKPANAAYTTTMEYDDAGRLIKQTVPGSGTGTKATSFEVNAAGETTKATDPAATTTMDYDLSGRLIKTTEMNGTVNGNASVAEYDLAGRKTAGKDLNAAGDVLRTYSYGYDLAGNPTSATSPEGHLTRQTYDALGRTTSLVEPVSASESITTSFGYDATGAPTRLTDGRGNATWTTYNSLGLAETVTEPATTAHPAAADRTWTHLYDAAGNLTVTIQPGGVRTDRTFDHLGRLTKESGAGGGATTAERTFGYDLASRRTTVGDLTVDYNDRGLPLEVSRGTIQETAYTYDGLGNPTQRIDAAGTAAFTYDSANRLKTTTDPVTSRTLTYGYDSVSRLKTITATSGTASTQTFDYDDMDRVKSQTLKNGSGAQLATITYGWDKDDNLTTKTTTGLAGAGSNTYGYDHAGRLTSWTAPGGAVTAYEWDAAGNRTKAGNATFTYDERNRLTSGDGTDYTYTPRGSLATSTKAGATTNYTFDAFDRLIADGDSLYSYDALNRMTSRIRGTIKQTFAYAGLSNDLAAITDNSGTVQAKYARDPGGGLLGLMEGTGAAVAALSDLHGDLVATFTTSLQTSTAYDPFGTITAQSGAKTNLGYQGEYTDPDTGKVNMHARWYQPGTGTFTSRDSATLSPSPSVQANRYTYANASPMTGADPTGHYTVGSGTCIGGCGRQEIGGGAIACDIQSCGSATVDPSWARVIELENEKKFWLGQDELERLGWKIMPNGRPLVEGMEDFWQASEASQMEFMENYSPDAEDFSLYLLWLAIKEPDPSLGNGGSGAGSGGYGAMPDPGCGAADSDKCKLFYESHHIRGYKWVANKPVKPPRVTNKKLKALLNAIYETDKVKGGVIGDGKVGSALEFELRTGMKIKGIYHANKAAALANALAKLLEDHSKGKIKLSPSDAYYAAKEFAEIWQVLNRAQYHPNVISFFRANPDRLKDFNNTIAKTMKTEAVKSVTGQEFRPQPGQERNPNAKNYHVPGAGRKPTGFLRGMIGLSEKIGVLGDLLFVLTSAACAANDQCVDDYFREEYGLPQPTMV